MRSPSTANSTSEPADDVRLARARSSTRGQHGNRSRPHAKAASERGEDEGLTADEVAFYDALAANDSAVQVLGDDELKVIAQELLSTLKRNVTVDWARRERVRAKLRLMVKDILADHGYPPDLSRHAVRTVLEQAEALSADWTRAAPGRLGASRSSRAAVSDTGAPVNAG